MCKAPFWRFFILFPLSLACTGRGQQGHLFILSGQSNMDGLKAGRDFTPEMKRLIGDNVVVVQDDERAQGIRRWVSEWTQIAARHGFEDSESLKFPDGDLYTRLLQTVRGQAGAQRFQSVTFVWMQGETDAMLKGYAPAYEEALSILIDQLKKDLQAPRMNVVIGRLSDFGVDKIPNWGVIRELQVAYVEKHPGMAWVDTDDLNDKLKNGVKIDDLHYTKEGYGILGKRFAAQAARLILNQPPAKNGRPDEP